MMRSGTVIQRRIVTGSVNGSGSGNSSSSSPRTICYASSPSDVADRQPPPLAAAATPTLSSSSSSFALSCFDRIPGNNASTSNSYYDHHKRRKRRQHHQGAYYYFGMDSFFYSMRLKYRVLGQRAAVFIVIYLATLLMTHGYRRFTQRNVSTTTSSSSSPSSSSTTAATMSFVMKPNNNNIIAYPTSHMIHDGQNYQHPAQQQQQDQQKQQRSHQQERRSYHDNFRHVYSNSNLRPSYHQFSNDNGNIRPLPPLPRPRQRDDDYMEPNFGNLDIYMLNEEYDDDDDNDNDHADDEYYDDDESHHNHIDRTAATSTTNEHFRREILEPERIDPEKSKHEFRREGHVRPHYDDDYYQNDQYIEDVDKYPENEYYWFYAMDDDVQRNPYIGWEDDNIQNERHCRRVAFHREIQINCNNFHEFDFQGLVTRGESSYVGGGAFRHVFKTVASHVDDEFIFKEAAYTKDHKFDFMDMEAMRMDGVIATALQPHPLFVDTYGFCALSQFSELMHQGDVEKLSVPYYERCDEKFQLNDHDDVDPWNDLEPTTKLRWALEMAESVAVLNNFEHGVIVHDDVQPPQWLPTKEGRLKFNDFNRAEVMLFDEENQEYCRYRNDVGGADWRAPEEYRDSPLNEAIDVWSLGNNFYSLLTGLMTFYEECDYDIIQQRIIQRETAYVDPRWRNHSFAEGLLVDIMEKCWEYDPDDRIEIGQLVLLLRQAVAENEKHEALLQQTVQETK